MVCAYRARASRWPKPLFVDPWAEQIAGQEGEAIAKKLDASFPPFENWLALRVAYFDRLIPLAVAAPSARAAREKAATDRAARVHRERDEREARQRAAADETFRRMKEQAARGGPSFNPGASNSGASAGSDRRPPRPGSDEAKLAEWYRTLDLQPGADLAQIKSAYRQLMRKYHPDLHGATPQKQKAATELSMRVTQAYNGLVEHLEKKK